MVTIPLLLLLGAFVLCLVSAAGKVPLWPAVLLLIIERGLEVLR